jgi:hypothetical protein
MANPNGLKRALLAPDAIGLHDKAGHFRRTNINRRDHGLTVAEGFEPFLCLTAIL